MNGPYKQLRQAIVDARSVRYITPTAENAHKALREMIQAYYVEFSSGNAVQDRWSKVMEHCEDARVSIRRTGAQAMSIPLAPGVQHRARAMIATIDTPLLKRHENVITVYECQQCTEYLSKKVPGLTYDTVTNLEAVAVDSLKAFQAVFKKFVDNKVFDGDSIEAVNIAFVSANITTALLVTEKLPLSMWS
ncbi:hypothetical protein BG015_011871 [Linnemannia schmuckeri]|uniref:Uncharacterized protein n=1 Tax=Linnemannia schmuckeri TaxID=64567 RepID=A0A9P5V7K2_9FUNG|nr:hypothetical protein BG015_011871 [Linnemannia schmuckeri]